MHEDRRAGAVRDVELAIGVSGKIQVAGRPAASCKHSGGERNIGNVSEIDVLAVRSACRVDVDPAMRLAGLCHFDQKKP
jgi:hypothetical protein